MNLQLAHIGDLSEMFFNVPYYQRGYRWETKQVCELLDDLRDFSLQDSPKGAFYCLQPLVVVENQTLSVNGKTVFDVIDGQQRLTTMFLIYQSAFNDEPIYHLRYDRASENNDPTDFEDGEITYNKLDNLTAAQIQRNPDYFYLSKAMEDIENWFKENKTSYKRIKGLIQDILINKDYETPETVFYKKTVDTDPNEQQKDVRFIWYDATEPTIDYYSSIAVFKRLNYGKTSLTSAELIKALLFQCDVYKEVCRPEKRQVAFRMSTQWDAMEKALQDKFMWSMIAPGVDSKISHIDFILSYVAAQLIQEQPLDIITSKDSDDYDYIVFNEYMKLQLKNGRNYGEIVEELWLRIQDVFDVFNNWFKDRELYHLIGLRLCLLNPKNKKKSKSELDNYFKELHTLYDYYNNHKRSEFITLIKGKIGKAINVALIPQKKNENPLTLGSLAYGRDDELLVKILLVYNVTMTQRNSQDRQYFPFWFYQNITPSLEHIHPQHLHDDEIDFSTRCKWYKEKREDLKVLTIPDKKKSDIEAAATLLEKVLLLTDEEEKFTDENAVKSYNRKKKEYEENISTYRDALNTLDELFDELADIDEEELHNIRNMALVDVVTNTILGNSLMAFKRQKLMKLLTKFNRSDGQEGAYIFSGTWKVFNKQFWHEEDEEQKRVKAANLLFWSKTDRENYFNELETIYKEYVNG